MAKAMREKDETPELEAKSHSSRFLAKAAKLAQRGKAGKRGKRVRGR